MESIKLKHFINPEPGNGLGFGHDNPKQGTNGKITYIFHLHFLIYRVRISGNKRWTMIKPPIKKPITAIKDGSCRLLRPLMACPEVHPPAYRAPKPIKKPPITSMTKPRKVKSPSQLNISSGKYFPPGF